MKNYLQAINLAIGKMLLAGLNDYGQVRNQSAEDRIAMVQAWAEVLTARRIKLDSIEPATLRMMTSKADFPSASRFADECQEWRWQNYAQIGIELANGQLFMAEVPINSTQAERAQIARQQAIEAGAEPAPLSLEQSGTVPMEQVRNDMGKSLGKLNGWVKQIIPDEEMP